MKRGSRVALAIISGVLLALAFPNVAWGWLALVALVPLILALKSAPTRREAFLLGGLATTLTWLINLPWVIIVMSRYGGLPQAAGVAIFVAMCLILGCYGALFALFVHLTRKWWAIPALWISIEYARTYLLSGFPWHLIATAVIDLTVLVQPVRWLGPYGLGFLIVAVNTAIARMILEPRRRGAVALALIAGLAVWILGGSLMLRSQNARIASERKFVGAMVQPNISQQMRWDEAQLGVIFERMMSLTEKSFAAGATVVVWPESTLPLTFHRTPIYRTTVENLSRTYNGDIILGSVAEDAADPSRIWNAAYLVSNGQISGRYDKLRLVPFGEYVPLRKLLFFAEKLVRAVGDFQFGTNEDPLVGKFKYGPAICYEVVYPRIPGDQTANGAEVLVTITNDGWFDRSSAPRQHLNHVRLRAVETDRYFLRAATTGISALIDPAGRIVQFLDLEQEGVIIGEFAPRQSRTAYVRFGDWAAWISLAVSLVALLARRFRGLRRIQNSEF